MTNSPIAYGRIGQVNGWKNSEPFANLCNVLIWSQPEESPLFPHLVGF
jgi:hypothetical protein